MRCNCMQRHPHDGLFSGLAHLGVSSPDLVCLHYKSRPNSILLVTYSIEPKFFSGKSCGVIGEVVFGEKRDTDFVFDSTLSKTKGRYC